MKEVLNRCALLLAFLCALTGNAWSCSIIQREDFLSNYEMVKVADAIILARSHQVLPPLESSPPLLRFEVIEVIKGEYAEKTLESPVGSTDEQHYRGPSKTDDFSRARPGTYAGSCTAGDFRLNTDYLLFLTKSRIAGNEPRWGTEKVGDVKWRVGVQILSRDLEEVKGEDDPWMQAVRRYTEIMRLNDYNLEKKALADLRGYAAAGNDRKRFPAALVADIDRHFVTASRLKSYADLQALYDAATDDRRRDAAVYAMAAAKYPEAFDLIVQRFKGTTVEYFGAVRDPRSVVILAEQFHKRKAMAARKEIQDSDQREIAEALARVATRSDTALMVDVLRAASPQDYESEVLSRWFVQNPSEEGKAFLREIVGADYSGKWRISQFLAMLGDEGIVQWAEREALTAKYIRAIYALAYSPLPKADQIISGIIARGDRERISILLYAYRGEGSRHNPRREECLREVETLWKQGM